MGRLRTKRATSVRDAWTIAAGFLRSVVGGEVYLEPRAGAILGSEATVLVVIDEDVVTYDRPMPKGFTFGKRPLR